MCASVVQRVLGQYTVSRHWLSYPLYGYHSFCLFFFLEQLVIYKMGWIFQVSALSTPPKVSYSLAHSRALVLYLSALPVCLLALVPSMRYPQDWEHCLHHKNLLQILLQLIRMESAVTLLQRMQVKPRDWGWSLTVVAWTIRSLDVSSRNYSYLMSAQENRTKLSSLCYPPWCLFMCSVHDQY